MKIQTNIYRWKGSKGVKKDSASQTLQNDSMSIKEMLQNHVQGVVDPSLIKEGQYDDENIDHETDVSHRQQKTLLDALDYANENAMTKQDIEDTLEALQETQLDSLDNNTNEQQEAVKTAQNDSTEVGE